MWAQEDEDIYSFTFQYFLSFCLSFSLTSFHDVGSTSGLKLNFLAIKWTAIAPS